MKLSLVAVFFVLVASSLAQSTSVTTFYNVNQGKTYIVDYGTNRTFAHANLFCKSHNATLIKIRSREENFWVRENLGKSHSGWFFLGVIPVNLKNDQNIVKSTRFMDGTEIKYDGCAGFCKLPFRCAVALVSLEYGFWQSVSCDLKFFAVCERPLIVADMAESVAKKAEAVDKLVQEKDKNITQVMGENAKLREKLAERERRREKDSMLQLKNIMDKLPK